MDHECKHEADLATLAHICTTEIPAMRQTIEKIFSRLEGNGTEGLVTRVAVIRSGLNRAWWWLGGVSLAILGVAGWAIRSGIS